MMKKQMSGFVPVNYKIAGKILLTLGLIGTVAKLVSYLFGWYLISNAYLYIGLALIIISLYLIFVVPEE